MDRKAAKELFKNDRDSYGKPKAIMHKIDQIYDDFEKKIADIESKEYMVRIELMKDAEFNTEGLSLASKTGGYRISSAKASGSWKLIKGFLCTIKLRDLKEYQIK